MVARERAGRGFQLLAEEPPLEQRLHVASTISDDQYEDFAVYDTIDQAKMAQQDLSKFPDSQRIELLGNRAALWKTFQRFDGDQELVEEFVGIVDRTVAGYVAVDCPEIVLSTLG